jgi:hypothetical protein
MMPTTVPNSPTNGAVEPMVARPDTPRFSSAWTIASPAPERWRSFDFFAWNFRTHLVSLEFLQSCDHHFGQMALLIPVRDLDGLVQLCLRATPATAGAKPAIASGRRYTPGNDRSSRRWTMPT